MRKDSIGQQQPLMILTGITSVLHSGSWQVKISKGPKNSAQGSYQLEKNYIQESTSLMRGAIRADILQK